MTVFTNPVVLIWTPWPLTLAKIPCPDVDLLIASLLLLWPWVRALWLTRPSPNGWPTEGKPQLGREALLVPWWFEHALAGLGRCWAILDMPSGPEFEGTMKSACDEIKQSTRNNKIVNSKNLRSAANLLVLVSYTWPSDWPGTWRTVKNKVLWVFLWRVSSSYVLRLHHHCRNCHRPPPLWSQCVSVTSHKAWDSLHHMYWLKAFNIPGAQRV